MPGLARKPRRRRSGIAAALWANAALLAVILVVLVARGDGPGLMPAAMAQPAQQPAIAGGAGLFVAPAQFSQNLWGAYVMDVDRQVLCAYQYFPGERQLRLVAARGFRHDHKLTNFNTLPDPADVEQMVNKAIRPTPAPATAPAE
jgi:hypothetical protein